MAGARVAEAVRGRGSTAAATCSRPAGHVSAATLQQACPLHSFNGAAVSPGGCAACKGRQTDRYTDMLQSTGMHGCCLGTTDSAQRQQSRCVHLQARANEPIGMQKLPLSQSTSLQQPPRVGISCTFPSCMCLLHLDSASMQGRTAGWQRDGNRNAQPSARFTWHSLAAWHSRSAVLRPEAGLGVRSAEGKQPPACTAWSHLITGCSP